MKKWLSRCYNTCIEFATLISQNAEARPATNMSGRYKGIQQKILEENKFAIYVPGAAHSLNLVGRSAVDCCPEAVNFFNIVQPIYTLFSASTNRWKILKGCLGDKKSGKISF